MERACLGRALLQISLYVGIRNVLPGLRGQEPLPQARCPMADRVLSLACCEGGVATVMKKQQFRLYSHVNSLKSWHFAVLIYGGTERRDSSGLSRLATTKSDSGLKGVKMWLYRQGGAWHAEQARWCG